MKTAGWPSLKPALASMIWSPDAAVLFGPVPELSGYFCACGMIPGFSQSGGVGRLAAEWMVEGEPSLDLFGWDLARYGAWAGKAFTKARVEDQYAHRFKIHFPGEERAAGRPVRRKLSAILARCLARRA